LVHTNGVPSTFATETIGSTYTGLTCTATAAGRAGLKAPGIVCGWRFNLTAVHAAVLDTEVDAAAIPRVVTAEIIDSANAGFAWAFTTSGDPGGFASGDAVFNGGSVGHDTTGNTVCDNIRGQALAHTAGISRGTGIAIIAGASIFQDVDFACPGFRNAGGRGAARVFACVAWGLPFGVFDAVGTITDQIDIAEICIGWAVSVFAAGGADQLA